MVNWDYWIWQKKLPGRDRQMRAITGIMELLTEKVIELRSELALQRKMVELIKSSQPQAVVRDAHTQILRLLLNSSMLTYRQVADQLGMAPSSVRVYVAEMRKLGVPLSKRGSGNRVLVGIEPEKAESVREFLKG